MALLKVDNIYEGTSSWDGSFPHLSCKFLCGLVEIEVCGWDMSCFEIPISID